MQIRILGDRYSVGDAAIYDLEINANALLASEPHCSRCIENLSVFTGTFIVTTDLSIRDNSGITVRYFAKVSF